ncbi:MAG: DUF4321 domain-containing protein [Lachnospiraceae bacterium]|jgi:hypothetical protein|nr:DUF4321 domain-containing protein [Lachnospiraceae bacterium]
MRYKGWVLFFLVIIGFILGNLIGTHCNIAFLSYGGQFGLTSPLELNLGFVVLTFGLTFNITIAGILGMVAAFVAYKFMKI